MLLECKKFPGIFLKKMRVSRIKKANDKQMAPFGRGVASAWLGGLAVKCRRPRLLIGKVTLMASVQI